MPKGYRRPIAKNTPPVTLQIRWDYSPRKVWLDNFDEYVKAIMEGLQKICELYAPEIEKWMKENASWSDRTSNARQGLYAEVYELVDMMGYGVMFDHKMEYGFWLEFANQGRFGIIAPALDRFGSQMFKDVKKLFRG